MDVENSRRIVFLGKTGAGKSSLANTILGEDVFKEGNSPNSETKKCEAKEATVNGRNICLVDTPGLFDTDMDNSELSPEILRCIEDCAPGPHAFLIVLKVEKYTEQEQDVVDEIIRYFSEEALKYTTVVFTRGGELPEGMRIEEWVRENEALRNLVDKCGGRCHVFDNKHWNNSQDQYRNNQVQVKELLETIEKTVTENGGRYYTNTFLQRVMRYLKRLWSRFKQFRSRDLLGAFLGREEAAASFETTFSTLLVSNPSVQSPEEEEGAGSSKNVQERDTIRIVLLGKYGIGKSSLGNTIFGEPGIFMVYQKQSFNKRSCQSETRTVNGSRIKLVDTPGLLDTDPTITKLSPEILRCIKECAPGPHAFLLVLKVGRYSKLNQAVVTLVLNNLSEEVLKFTTVVFTYGNDLPEGMRIEEWVNKSVALKTLVENCGGRCHVFDNKYWNNSQDQYRNNQVQVKELLETIDKTVEKNRSGYYTNEMLQIAFHERQSQTGAGARRKCIIL